MVHKKASHLYKDISCIPSQSRNINNMTPKPNWSIVIRAENVKKTNK